MIGVTTVRRKKNHVKTLLNSNGVWVNDPIELEMVATNYFKVLFSSNEPLVPYVLEGHSPMMEEQVSKDSVRDITNKEIQCH